MSQAHNQAEFASQNEQGLTQQAQTVDPTNTTAVAAESQKTPLFYYNQQYQQWALDPYYHDYFNTMVYGILPQLREVVNQKWTEEETIAYLKFIDQLVAYIYYYILTSTTVQTYEQYEYYIDCTKNTGNPVGFVLYEKQLNYLQRLSGVKVKKEPNAKPEPVRPKKQVEEKEKVVVRSGDPEINLQKLMNMEWDNKYINTSIFHKENVNVVFIGHVDAGKSTLTGNILKELNEVDQQELTRNRQDAKQNKMEAFEQSGISDVIPEERIDGKTRQFAKLCFSLQKKRFTLFDAPGHKNYVPNMIMGACQADIAVLIISSKMGQFQSGFEKEGQTKQHAMLAKALGVVELIVVVTKMGISNWDQKRFNHIKEQVQPFLEGACGFHDVVFIPVDSILNQNVHKKHEAPWYKGPHLTEYLDNLKLPERKPLGPLRMPIIDKFKDQGNLHVYGKIESGTILQDQTVTVLPQRIPMVIRQIYNAKDERLPFAMAGENVKLRVKGVDEDDISRGNMMCNNLNYCQESSQFKAHISILELPEKKKLVSSGYECIIHMHAIAAEVEIFKIEAKIEKGTEKKIVVGFLKPGESGICVIKVERPLCLEKYEFMHSLGRFTLRDEGKTIGYGTIIGIKPAKTLLKEQKEQLVGDSVNNLTKQVQNVSLSNTTQ